ncbi:50S ribosomal protein L19 [Candidatus Aerophobetes bacterium]|uniref:Large ribosomal subunit protein bL19 n=1 Tax=Aerophobetes bacterium TaxID=2030807 RepID=A0A2A4X6R8_UNCAE|nr:MAG: 50S ribosomal protein L19 [Candidatus Aerophobetes bacterium]
MNEIEELENQGLKTDLPSYRVGDTIKVYIRIVEGGKERVQAFTGVVIGKQGKGIAETVLLYRHSYGSGVERVFSIHSPLVSKIEVVRCGQVRQAKLYYLRGQQGKKIKVKERLFKSAKKLAKEAKS